MAYLLDHDGRGHAYVTRPPTQAECNRYIRNGYNPPAMERESDRAIYLYLRGDLAPNYPVPAIDYYNSANPDHIPIGNMMELAYPVELQLALRA